MIGNQELFSVFVLNAVYFISFNVYFPYITIYFNNYLHMSYTASGMLQGIRLVAAVVLTIPAARMIDRGRPVLIVSFAIVANFIGLLLVSVSNHMIMLLFGIFGTGVGYVLVLQALTPASCTVTVWNR